MPIPGLCRLPATAVPPGEPAVGSAGSVSVWWSDATNCAEPRSQPRRGGDWPAVSTVNERAELDADNNKEIRSWVVWGSPERQERSA